MANPVGLQQLLRMQGLEWGDSGRGSGDFHLWFDGGSLYTDASWNPQGGTTSTAPDGASSGAVGKGFAFTTGAGGGGNANGGPFTVTLGAGTGTGTIGQLSIVPAAGNGVNIGTVAIGSTSVSVLVPDNTTTIHFIRLTQNFAGTLNAPSGNSARLLGVDAHWVDATNSVATLAGIYAFGYNDAVTGVTDLIGVIGRAFITSTGTSTNMYGVRGDVNFSGAGTVTNASGVLTQGGSNTAAGVITTYSGFRSGALNFTTLGLTVTDGYGAFISMPSNASGNNIGVQIGTQVSGTIAALGLLVGSNGAWFRGTAPTPLVDTGGTAASIAIYAGSSAGANTALCALYYYRSSTSMGYCGFDSDTSTIAGHTKAVTDYLIAPNNQRAMLVDSSKNVWIAGTLATGGTIVNNHVPVAINSSATATAAQAASGYITSTSAAPTTITLPTGTNLGAQLGATQGTTFDLYIDNTAGASTVTVAVNTNAILSADAAANAASAGLLTVPSGVTGQACFRLMFSSATAYTFTRIA